jgi:hypothetical protein
VAAGSVDIRPLNEIFALSDRIWSCPLRLGLLRGGKVAESPDSVAGIGTADTSDIIRAKTSATRPARERIFE